MPLRDKLARRAAPYLEPGEQIQVVFLAQSGPSPWWILLSVWIVIFTAGYRTVVVTDRAIVLLRNGRLLSTFPKALALRGPRVYLGEPSGLWGSIQLDRRYWVHKRFHKDVAAANAMMQQAHGAPPIAPPAGPPPYGPPAYGPPSYTPPPSNAQPPYGPPQQEQYGTPPQR